MWGLRGITGTKSASRGANSESKITFFGSKSVQERSKRSSRGSLRASASKMRFRPRFGPRFKCQNETLRPQKSRNFVRRPQSFTISPFSVRVTSGTRFGTPKRPPGWPKRLSRELQDRSRGSPRLPQERPIAVKEVPKSAPRCYQVASRLPRALQELSKRYQDGFGSNLGAIGKPFWMMF